MIFKEARIQRVSWESLAWIALGLLAVFAVGRLPVGAFQSEMGDGADQLSVSHGGGSDRRGGSCAAGNQRLLPVSGHGTLR